MRLHSCMDQEAHLPPPYSALMDTECDIMSVHKTMLHLKFAVDSKDTILAAKSIGLKVSFNLINVHTFCKNISFLGCGYSSVTATVNWGNVAATPAVQCKGIPTGTTYSWSF